MFTQLKPFIPSGSDYSLARAFFKDLGFQENWGSEELCELQWGEAVFLLQNYANQELQENLMLYLNTSDLDAFYQHIQDLDLSGKYPAATFSKPEMRPWGVREMHLIDLAGVCWHIA